MRARFPKTAYDWSKESPTPTTPAAAPNPQRLWWMLETLSDADLKAVRAISLAIEADRAITKHERLGCGDSCAICRGPEAA